MLPELIDTHAHLDDERFAADLPTVLERAAAAGVGSIVTMGVTASSSRISVNLAAQHPGLFAAVGIQPTNVAAAAATDWGEVVKLATHDRVVAIGETGLDGYWDATTLPQQEVFFARHLDLARKRGLAVVIHCRQAETEVLRMLREDYERHGPVCGVMHCFSGDATMAAACLDLGLYLSFAGVVTYKNAQSLHEVARQVPLDRLLIETDSPYLAPVPVRGRRNKPAFVAHTAALIAELREVEVTEIAAQTTRNARRFFGLKVGV